MPSDKQDRFFVSRGADNMFAVIDRNTGSPADLGVTSIKLLQSEAEELVKRLNRHAIVGGPLKGKK
ncbi:hypothetical protein JNB88_07615 [Rhizobium cauense]|uniref:hypothetical protein n=1 Tax=Rhizobium cauense TaxID=1166683 RepID=UPI00055CBE89|nr:hypothetical protein [Rhizobium cauense]MBW9113509.1 hypothetical protein [Rhizobium cauense]